MTAPFIPRPIEELSLEWPPDLDHFSASGAKMAVRCPEQWRQRYVLGVKQVPALALIAGRADHAAIEASMEQKINSGVDLPVPEVRERFVDKLEREVEWSGGIQEVEVRNAETKQEKIKALDSERREGQELVAMYHREISPHLQPIAVEKPFEVLVPGLPVKVVGRIDLIAGNVETMFAQASGQEDLQFVRMIDRKRRGRATRKIEPEWAIQAEVYQYAEPMQHDWHLSVTTKKPQVMMGGEGLEQPLRRRELLEKQLQHIVGSIGYFYVKYGPDEPWPAHGRLHSWACNYCGYRPDCWAWQS